MTAVIAIKLAREPGSVVEHRGQIGVKFGRYGVGRKLEVMYALVEVIYALERRANALVVGAVGVRDGVEVVGVRAPSFKGIVVKERRCVLVAMDVSWNRHVAEQMGDMSEQVVGARLVA